MQCPNCDTKDQVTIAGKTFCANCGTLAPDASQSGSSVNPQTPNQNPITATTALPSTAQAPQVAPVPQAASTVQPAQAGSTDITAPASFARFQTPANTAQPVAPMPQPAPVKPSILLSQPVVAVVPPETAPVVPAPSGPPAPAPDTANKARAAIEHVKAQATPVVSNQPKTPMPMTDIKPQAPAPVSAPVKNDETIGSELSSLDSHDEGVFTDDQLNELANTTKSPGNPHKETVARPMNDIRASSNQTNSRSVVEPTAQPASNPQPNSASNRAPLDAITPVAPVAGSTIVPQTHATQSLNPAAAKAATQAASQSGTLVAQTEQDTSQTKDRSKGKKIAGQLATAGLSVAGVILLGMYVWQINYPNLALKVASSKAGISATMPSYLPNGWKITGDIAANPGSVNYTLQSPDGNKSVSINENRTDWDSQALAENYLSSKTDNYKALQTQGLTIYLYNNQATWVNHGTWYRIEGNDTGLNQDQIIKMATSL